MGDAASVLEIPVVVTEQYPKIFGSTMADVGCAEGTPTFAKRKFSMMTDEVRASNPRATCALSREFLGPTRHRAFPPPGQRAHGDIG